ncbi:MAG: amidohydrolase family protein [Saprospiraceae bacterium]
MRTFFFLAITLLFTQLHAQFIPGSPQANPIAITGATAHLGTGEAIENAVLTFAAGKLTYVGAVAGAPSLEGHTVIDATGKDVYPGFIAMNSRLGLVEIDAVRATDDMREVGYLNPNARSLIAFNTDSEIIPTVRNIGVLIGQVTPDGRGLAGQSSAMSMDGWNWEDAAIGADEGMHLHWPSNFRMTGWWAAPGGMKKNDKYAEQTKNIQQYFDEAKAYSQSVGAVDNPRFASMKPVFAGKRTLYIHASYAREIEDAIAFADRYKLKPILVGGEDAYLLTGLLKEKGISVVVGDVHALPERGDDLVSQPFETPAQLHAAGIPIAFSVGGAWEQRRLPHHAGHAVGFGLPYEQAVKGLTLTPATMMNIADRVGSLEVGKDATLFISAGDALDMRTNKLQQAWIGGREVDLRSRQTELAKKYKEKYKRGE